LGLNHDINQLVVCIHCFQSVLGHHGLFGLSMTPSPHLAK